MNLTSKLAELMHFKQCDNKKRVKIDVLCHTEA